jgi:hypothetical protein
MQLNSVIYLMMNINRPIFRASQVFVARGPQVASEIKLKAVRALSLR